MDLSISNTSLFIILLINTDIKTSIMEVALDLHSYSLTVGWRGQNTKQVLLFTDMLQWQT